ncbi:pyridoxamine 5'-phosphate oxidase-related FMN-binding protein [Solidesulfovibrio fructosivorans JJ]]|uniref:Pyridoxamine 5'-phosphate oxidase-related FMN-binding protein n=1 Tax=Solidesulfovibrio fructosivorans JJ] TaxID=596151 RepID=E1JZW5_SOLFR|nr:pyridoxamine 5'-phosphate oxidase family protein [Solidesulfovibrio fructosivorans]EFL50060.1 pyridoxamine 5'-phosphate oxidase-related FMN-binding protein [Solidesulfovibrio fructosivorans JJ]]
MRKKERELTDRGVLEEQLMRAKVCRLGLYDGAWPYVVPVNIGYAAGHLYFHSSLKGKKMDILRQNPKVCFEIDSAVEIVTGERPCDYTAYYKSVIGFGTAVFLEDEAEKVEGLRILMRHFAGPEEGFRPEVVSKTAVVRIDIESMTGKSNPPMKEWS